jgi:Stress responsive A/B Barrel Domain
VFHHLTLIAFSENAPEETVSEVLLAGRDLPRKIDAISSMSCGPLYDGEHSWDVGFELAFEDQDRFEIFKAHPAHEEFVRLRVHPYASEVFSVDYVDTAITSVPRRKGEER